MPYSSGVSSSQDAASTWSEVTPLCLHSRYFGVLRRRPEIRRFFDGLEVVEPGVVDVNSWRPDGREEQQAAVLIEYGGVARKP
ncbi:MAG: SAM-dependent methyltransferase [Streptosporangiaceae bacterium]